MPHLTLVGDGPEPDRALRAVDLFCGCGGMSAGLISAGIEVVEAYDRWEAALAVYVRNIGAHAVSADLADTAAVVERISALGVDMIAGSPPCQEFSSAGPRTESARANLTAAFAEIVDGCRPAGFLMENVPQAAGSAAWKSGRQILEQAGYTIVETALDASRFGVPQRRRRLFVFGHSDELVAWRFLADIEAAQTQHRTTVREYMGGEIRFDHYYQLPRSYQRRGVFSVDEPAPTIRGTNRPIAPGYPGHPLDSAPHSEVRALTSAERARIQTFPEEWEWPQDSPKTAIDLMIGNAVPVEMAAAVGRSAARAVQVRAESALGRRRLRVVPG